MELKSGIYQIKNIINNKVYVGSTIDFERRKYEHFQALNNNNHGNPKLQNAFNQHIETENIFVFEILEQILPHLLLEREQHYIDTLKAFENGYNISSIAKFPIGNNAIPIIQLSLDNKIIAYHTSYKAAARSLDIKDGGVAIGCAVQGIQKSAYGFKWVKFSPELKEEEIIEIANSIQSRHSNIQQIHPITGEIILVEKPSKILESLNLDRSTLWKYCKSLHKYNNFYWRRMIDSETLRFYLGCDVGKNGALSLISESGDIVWNFQMPKIATEIDIHKLSQYLFHHRKFIKHCVIEDVHSIFGTGAKANFQFGKSLGILEGVMSSLNIPFTKITPKEWQSKMWEGIKPVQINTGKQTKEGNIKYKIDTKATSLLAVKRLFPEINLCATERSKKASDGIVDALLMAEYCRRKFK